MPPLIPEKQSARGQAEPIADENYQRAIVAPVYNKRNAVARPKAAFALAGHTVHDLSSGGFSVCRFNLAKHCPDRRALAGFAKLVGVHT